MEGERQLFSGKYSWFPDHHHHPTLCDILFGTVRSRPKWPFTGQWSEPSLIMHHQRAHDCKSNTTLYLYIFIVWKRKGAKKHIRTTRATTETLSVNLALNRIPLSYFDFRTPAPFPLSVRRRQETRLLFRLLLLEAAYLSQTAQFLK